MQPGIMHTKTESLLLATRVTTWIVFIGTQMFKRGVELQRENELTV